MKKNTASILFLTLFFMNSSLFANDILKNYSSSLVDQWRSEISKSFDSAEKEVYDIKPDPSPDVEPKIDPDPKKCACKGTGKIVQGDSHVTICPYHGQNKETPSDCPDGKCQLTKTKITCQCETKCGCKICQCKKVEIK